MFNWLKGIINSFLTPVTNGFTEGYNKIKILKNTYCYQNFLKNTIKIEHICNIKRKYALSYT